MRSPLPSQSDFTLFPFPTLIFLGSVLLPIPSSSLSSTCRATWLTSTVPGVSFAHQLRYVIQKARRQRIFPAETRGNSPGPEASQSLTDASPLDFDLFFAEHLLNQPFEPVQQAAAAEDWPFATDQAFAGYGEVQPPWNDFPALGE